MINTSQTVRSNFYYHKIITLQKHTRLSPSFHKKQLSVHCPHTEEEGGFSCSIVIVDVVSSAGVVVDALKGDEFMIAANNIRTDDGAQNRRITHKPHRNTLTHSHAASLANTNQYCIVDNRRKSQSNRYFHFAK